MSLAKNKPIELVDISPEFAGRAMAYLYRTEFLPVAPTKFVGVLVEQRGYIIVITNLTLTAVLRYTNKEVLKPVEKYPRALTDIISEHVPVLRRAPDVPLARLPMSKMLGKGVAS